MLDNKKCGEEVECCEQEETLKPNCQQDDWEELEVECGDVFSAECVGILAEKIYDCVYLEHLQFADKDEEFIIDGFEDLSDDDCDDVADPYRTGAAICIDEIGLSYDFIGVKDEIDCREGGQLVVKFDSEKKVLDAVSGSGYYNSEGESNDNLYNEFEGILSYPKCISEPACDEAVKTRIFKSGLRFYVANLKVRVHGRIGCKKFSASKDYALDSDEPIEITKCADEYDLGCDECGSEESSVDGLNFGKVNLYGRVNRPKDGGKINVHIEFDTCLSAECIETSERYGDAGRGRFNATIGYSFLVTHNIRHTITEQIAVFTNPNGISCRDTGRESDCTRKC